MLSHQTLRVFCFYVYHTITNTTTIIISTTIIIITTTTTIIISTTTMGVVLYRLGWARALPMI